MEKLGKKEINKRVGANIKFKREQYGMSISDLADELDISDGFVGCIERGERGTTVENLIFLASFFSVSLDQLILHNLAEDKLAEDNNESSEEYNLLSNMIKGLTSEECKFLISVIREMKKLTY